MSETPDVYFESFHVEGGSSGVVLSLHTHRPGGSKPTEVAVVRTSWEHLKLLTFVLHRWVQKTEADQQVSYPMAIRALQEQKIAKEDWDAFWKNFAGPT